MRNLSLFRLSLPVHSVLSLRVLGHRVLRFVLGQKTLAYGIIRQRRGINNFARLRDFNLLLKEQELDDEGNHAKLRINKSLFEIPFEEIKTISILGEGGSNSIVFRAKWNDMIVAFKCFKTRTIMTSQDKFVEFEKEVSIFSSLSHPSIIRFFGATLNPPRVGIVMEFASNGEILEYVVRFRRESGGSRYPLPQKLRMIREISSAMKFLHSRNIIHRDLKCENVLVSQQGHTKLMDFGLSRIVDRFSATKTMRIVYIILTESVTPYGDHPLHQIEFKVANNPSFRPDITKLEYLKRQRNNYEWLIQIITKCWNHDPDSRYSFSEIYDILGEQRNNNIEDVGEEVKIIHEESERSQGVKESKSPYEKISNGRLSDLKKKFLD